jgi:hypothetical protein
MKHRTEIPGNFTNRVFTLTRSSGSGAHISVYLSSQPYVVHAYRIVYAEPCAACDTPLYISLYACTTYGTHNEMSYLTTLYLRPLF